MIRMIERFKGAQVVRTRDPAIIERKHAHGAHAHPSPRIHAHIHASTSHLHATAEMDVVVDVGGVFDAERLRFDHHQRDFCGTFDDAHTTKLSSAGLVRTPRHCCTHTNTCMCAHGPLFFMLHTRARTQLSHNATHRCIDSLANALLRLCANWRWMIH